MTSTSTSQNNIYFDGARLHSLQVMLVARCEELFEELGISLERSNKMFFGRCPVHGGDNHGALNLYHSGNTVPGFWKCNTWHCEKHFKKTIIGFVRGVLSHQRYDWHPPREKGQKLGQMVGFNEAVDWCCKFLGQDLRNIKVDRNELAKRQFAAEVGTMTRRAEQKEEGLTRGHVRAVLKIPAQYYLERGYTREILERYDVGFYPHRGRPLTDRVAVPVYDNNYRYVAGFTGRSIFLKCDKCERWHHSGEACPEKNNREAWAKTSKWYNHEFNKESYLYNFWFAKKFIAQTGIAVIVEGPGEIWRLEEANIKVGLGLFGTELSDQQQVLLETSGAMNLVVATNNDDAGNKAFADLKDKLHRSFRIHRLNLSANDLGEMTPADVRELVVPVLTRIKDRGY